MESRLPATLLVLCLGMAEARAQFGLFDTPLEVPTNARCVAMGESFVAVPAEPTALMSNPAGLAGLRGVGISYSQRSFNWSGGTEKWKYHGANAFVALPFGTIALQYNRFSMGEILITTASSPDGIGTSETFLHTIVLGFGAKLPGNVSVGFAAKYHDIVDNVSAPASEHILSFSYTPAYLFDGGVQYSIPFRSADSTEGHTFTAGLSLQNIGTDMKVSTSPHSLYYPDKETSQELPGYLRIGASYRFDVLARKAGELQPAALLFTAEYRRLLNSVQETTYGRDFVGFGAECTALEIVSLRMGGVVRPHTSIYGEKGKLMWRVGVGVRLPLEQLGVPLPFVVSGGYARITIDPPRSFYAVEREDHFSVFSIELEYRPG